MTNPRTITLEDFVQMNIDEQEAVSEEIARILDAELAMCNPGEKVQDEV